MKAYEYRDENIEVRKILTPRQRRLLAQLRKERDYIAGMLPTVKSSRGEMMWEERVTEAMNELIAIYEVDE